MNPFVSLPSNNLESLLDSFSNGALKFEISHTALLKTGITQESAKRLSVFISENCYSSEAIIVMIQTIIDTRYYNTNIALTQSLVVTGPETQQGANLRTGSRFIQIVEHAKHELMLATFALYQGDQILEPIHQAILRNPDLEVTLILNIQRPYGDRTITEDLIEKARQDFLNRSWPWDIKPKVYYYPASLKMEARQRSSMHAKFLIADEERCFITSANFTEAAQKRNIEIGVELQHSLEPKALSRYFKELISNEILGQLI